MTLPDAVRNSPTYIPLWLAKRQWRLDGRRKIDDARAFMIGYRMASRCREDRWQIWAEPWVTLDGRRRQPAFYGVDRPCSTD